MSDTWTSYPTADDLLRHAGWLRRLAERLVGADSADDLVQDTWLSALRHRPAPGIGLGAWLRRVILNRAASDARSRTRRQVREAARARRDVIPSTSDVAARAEATRLLVDAVLQLKPMQRDVILLRYFDGVEPAEIAERLGLPGATVRSHLARGLARLRKDLDAAADGDRARWVRALAPLAPVASTTIHAGHLLPLPAALIMTTAQKVSAGFILAAVGVGLVWWQVGADPVTPPSESVGSSSSGDLVAGVAAAEERGGERTPPVRSELSTADRRVRGVLLDSKTGAPVPHFALGFARGKPRSSDLDAGPPAISERVITDAEGRFRSAKDYEAGSMRAVLLEDWDRFDSVMQVFGARTPRDELGFAFAPGEPVEIRVSAGPAFLIESPDAERIGVDQFLALLTDAEVLMGSVSLPTHLITLPTGPAPMMARFLPLDATERRMRPDKLHLLSTDGAWDGWADLEAGGGSGEWPPDPVSIRLFACGTLDLLLRAVEDPQPREARVAWYEGALSATEVAAAKPLWELMTGGSIVAAGVGAARRSEPLRFSVRYQRVGAYTAVVRSRGFTDLVTTIDIRQGERDPRELHLSRSGAASGTITGTVRPKSGHKPSVELVVWIQATDADSGSMEFSNLEWSKRDGRWVGRFAFRDLLDDEYRVWVNNGPRVPRPARRPSTVPRERRVRPSALPVVFDLLGDPPTSKVVVRASDRRTGESLDEFTVFPLTGAGGGRGREQESVETHEGRVQLRLPGDPDSARLLVYAAGHSPAFVALPSAPSASGVFEVDAGLDAGWGAAIRVSTRRDGKGVPLAGAVVFADGVEVGRSDLEGLVFPRVLARPKRLTVRFPGYTLESHHGPIDGDGTLRERRTETDLESIGFVMRR